MKTNSVHFFNGTKIKSVCNNCEITLAVWELKNPSNIGHIIRLAQNIDAKAAIFIGEIKNYRESKIKKTAGFSFVQQPWEMISADEFGARTEKAELVILETCEGSVNIFEASLPEKTILLAGNEAHGLPADIIAAGKIKVHIPMPGKCKSMNISHALSVAAFEWYRQHSS